MTLTPRNHAVDWLKGVMIVFIVFVHSGTIPGLFHGYLAVDIFFFIAGYYLMRSFNRKPETAIKYTWHRIKNIYLPYILCFLFSCVLRYEGLTHFADFDSFIEKYAQFAFSLSLTEEIGPRIMYEHILFGSWFLSVLVIAGFLLYSMLEYNDRFAIHILFPAICILGFTFIFTNGTSAMNWARIGAISLPLLRGLTELAAGALIYKIRDVYHDALERRGLIINIAFILSLVLYLALMFTERNLDVYLIATAPWILLGAVIEKSWLNRFLSLIRGGLISAIGKRSLYVLLAHPPALLIIHWSNENLLNNRFGNLAIFCFDMMATGIATIILFYTCKWLRERVLPR
ncbi:MAG: acyltransferase [Bacteroidales bacterium]|nr:acyltransferase [Bacteroidales bacterium]